MKKLFFILTTIIFFSIDAMATDCSDISVNPAISVSYSFGKLSIDKSKDTGTISQIAESFNLTEHNTFTRGLATANVKYDVSIQTAAHPIGIKQFCVVPADIKILISLENPTIYLANNLQEGSCDYNIVLRHEKTHQQINKTALEYYLPIFKASVTNIAKKIPAVPVNDLSKIEETTKILTENYSKKITPFIDFIKNEIAKEQAKLDNKANYQYEDNLCQKLSNPQ